MFDFKIYFLCKTFSDVDDAMYDFIDDIDELEMYEVEDDEFDNSIITFDGHRGMFQKAITIII